MYARGILFGKMKYELGDHSFVRCPESGLEADIEFKTKGYFSGKYDAIGGIIKDTKSGKNLFELSGVWNGEMSIKDLTVCKLCDKFVALLAASAPVVLDPDADKYGTERQEVCLIRCFPGARDLPIGATS